MKRIYFLVVFVCMALTCIAQNPLIIKTVSSTNLEPSSDAILNKRIKPWNGKIFYQGIGSSSQCFLNYTDGTATGTINITDLGAVGTITGVFPAQDFVYVVTSKMEIVSTSPFVVSYTYRLWKSNGTAAGTSLLKLFDAASTTTNIPSFTTDALAAYNLSIVGNTIYFQGYDIANGCELWVSDGTAAGTKLVKDIRPGTAGGGAYGLCSVGGTVCFFADNGTQGYELWKTDGTATGTVMLKEINTSTSSIAAFYAGVYKNKMYFFANDGNTGNEPWYTDGTAAGTQLLKDINPGTGSSFIVGATRTDLFLVKDNNFLYFPVNNSQYVWRTDGTETGTIQLAGPMTSSTIAGTIAKGNGIYWQDNVTTLYKSDGTVAGTTKVVSNLIEAVQLYSYKGAAWFAARAANNSDLEPWRSDGLASNTNKALDIYPGAYLTTLFSGSPYGYFELNNYLYFFATNASGNHLFRYNGDFTYNGSQTGGRWKDSANWNSMMPPGITDTVYINTGTANALTIDGQKAYAGLLKMQAGTTINFANTTDSLFVGSTLATTSSNNFTGNGVLVLKNASNEPVQLSNGFSANNVSVQSNTNLQSGTVTINGLLNLNNNAKLSLNSNNLVLAGNTSSAAGNATSYIVTNGTGKLTVQNIGTGARTAAVIFPIGTSNSYNPVQLSNAGTADNFSIRVQPQVNGAYTGETVSGSPYFTNAVDATWFITEGTIGGSSATINLQWDAAQELLGFNRNQSRFGHYTSGSWLLGTAGAASGSSPYSFTGTGITSFSPFGIFNSNAALPIYSAKLLVTKTGSSNKLSWNIVATDASNIAIEKSADGRQFTELKSMPFIAVSSFNDVQVNTIGKTYYRLKVLDKNGQSAYSNTISIANENVSSISVYPTAVQSQFTVQNNTNSKLVMQLYNASGKLMVTQALNIGTNFIATNQFTTGSYHYKIYNNAMLLNTGTIIKL